MANTWFPFTLGLGSAKDSNGDQVRVNMNGTFSVTASGAFANAGTFPIVVQGFTSSPGDGGRATIDGGTNTGALISQVGIAGATLIDIVFKTSIGSGTSDLVIGLFSSVWIRCVFTGSRQKGLSVPSSSLVIECEAYNNNNANTAAQGAFHAATGNVTFTRCIAHDNAGSNTSGFFTGSGTTTFQNCISETNGKYGIAVTGTSSFNGIIAVSNCDLYNNGSDGVNIVSGNQNGIWIENTNLVKNAGAGINNASATANSGFVYNNGYGAGTQANGSGDTLGSLIQSGKITYASNVAPWVDPANGDFRINLPAAINAGRGAFLETAASYAGSVGYPDVGSAQHYDVQKGFTFGG